MMQTNDDTYDLAGYVMRLQKDLSDYKHTAVVLQQRLIAAREECEALRAKLNGELEERDERIRGCAVPRARRAFPVLWDLWDLRVRAARRVRIAALPLPSCRPESHSCR